MKLEQVTSERKEQEFSPPSKRFYQHYYLRSTTMQLSIEFMNFVEVMALHWKFNNELPAIYSRERKKTCWYVMCLHQRNSSQKCDSLNYILKIFSSKSSFMRFFHFQTFCRTKSMEHFCSCWTQRTVNDRVRNNLNGCQLCCCCMHDVT